MTDHGRGNARLRLILLVFAGGVIGTAAREAIVLALPGGGVPWGVLLVNLVGSFALGFLVAALGAGETAARRDVRLFAGTGAIGGFTTYSALATDTVVLLETQPSVALAYALGSVAAGLACAAAGLALAGRLVPTRRPPKDAAA
ncbi:fluoride efflux transporter FluC [Microbacterium sp. NPDC055357]